MWVKWSRGSWLPSAARSAHRQPRRPLQPPLPTASSSPSPTTALWRQVWVGCWGEKRPALGLSNVLVRFGLAQSASAAPSARSSRPNSAATSTKAPATRWWDPWSTASTWPSLSLGKTPPAQPSSWKVGGGGLGRCLDLSDLVLVAPSRPLARRRRRQERDPQPPHPGHLHALARGGILPSLAARRGAVSGAVPRSPLPTPERPEGDGWRTHTHWQLQLQHQQQQQLVNLNPCLS